MLPHKTWPCRWKRSRGRPYSYDLWRSSQTKLAHRAIIASARNEGDPILLRSAWQLREYPFLPYPGEEPSRVGSIGPGWCAGDREKVEEAPSQFTICLVRSAQMRCSLEERRRVLATAHTKMEGEVEGQPSTLTE